ncbi:MAG: RsmD family RNA methyltransferase [Acidimicrobiales bacterium]
MRIIAGTARGRTIKAPEGRGLARSPTGPKRRSSTCLVSLGGVDDAVVFDLFAGSGSFASRVCREALRT